MGVLWRSSCQDLGLLVPLVWVQFLDRDPRSHKLCGVAKKREKPTPQCKGSQAENLILPFVLFKPSPGCMRPICIREGVCFTQTVNSHVNLTWKHPD